MFTKSCFAIALCLLPVLADAQAPAGKITVTSRQEVVIRPRFKGDLHTYIQRNVQYPLKARENGVQGKCVVEFVVDEKGGIQKVSNIQSSGNELLDKEAERLVASMPAWRPGSCNQQPASYYYSLPINFELH